MFRRHIIRELSAYLDNQLSDKDRLKVEGHLRDCRLCSQELSKLKMVSEKIKNLPAPDLGPFFEEAVKEKIRDPRGLERGEVKMKRRAWYLLIPSGVLAGILVFVFLGQITMKQVSLGRLRESADYINIEPQRKDFQHSPRSEAGATRSGRNNDFKVAEREKFSGAQKKHPVAMAPVETYYSQSADEYVLEGRGLAMHSVDGSVALGDKERPDLHYSYQDNGAVVVIQPVLPATGEGEKIIRTAEIRLEVENGQDTYKNASVVCQELGGYLASSNFYEDREGRQAGTITMRIPKDKFLAALDKLSALGKVEGSSTQSHDVSQEYANLQANYDAAMVVYNKMLEALKKRQNTIPEAVRLESELTPVLQRIANLKNQMESLNNSVSFTTLNLYFHEATVSAKVLKEARQNIQKSMLAATINAVRFFGNSLPVAIVLIVWIVVILVTVLLMKKWIKKLRKHD